MALKAPNEFSYRDKPLADIPAVEPFAAEGSVRIARGGSRWCWATRIFVAYRR